MRDLNYWYTHTSMLGFARVIRDSYPFYIRPFIKIYADEKWLDNRCQVIRIYYGINGFPMNIGNKLCFEMRLEDFEKEANGKKTITKEK